MGALAAGISAGASLLNGITGGKAAKKQAAAQGRMQQAALAQQNAQFQQTQQNISPFLGAGQSALGASGDLLGLNGNDVQGTAIQALKDSPLFQSQYGTGVDTILQNAAATGGLRGGNIQGGLANFGSGLLASVIQNQLGNLGGLVNTGANAAAGLANAGQNNANAVSNIYGNIGNAQAGGILGSATAQNNTVNSLSSILQSYLANRGGVSAGGSIIGNGLVAGSGQPGDILRKW